MHRLAAALVALIVWTGLAIQFSAAYANHHDLVATLWILARFFTVISNLLVAIAMTSVAIDWRVPPLILGGLTLAIMLVGVVYATLLSGLHHLTGPALVADFLLHKVSPIAMALWWVLCAPRAQVDRTAPLWWTAYPLVYFVYVLARGHYDGRYPYPFIDVANLGWVQTALNAGGIALGLVLAGYALVWIDSWRPLGSKRARA
jgi:hypothetical protein